MLFKTLTMKMCNLVILFSLCVVKCSAMSLSELEEFSNFLEMTSQLDLNVKSNGPDEEYDENEPISDHAWEESGKFEGDLILNERQRRLLVADIAEGLSRNGLQDSTKRWPDNEVIYYIQREHFSSGQVQAIVAGIEDLAQASCVKFRPYRKGDRDAVVIQGSRRGCFSQVGYQGGYQVLNLSGRHPVGRGCFRHGTVVHELLHSLGFYHMQSSPDRDDYIDVLWPNIVQAARHNFRKYNSFAVNDFGVGYDYASVLHYSKKAFSSNGQDTLVPKQRGVEIGQRVGLSQKDIQKLNRMYCDIDSNDSSNSDDSATPKKPVIIKKKSKNKPFEGHGIGYHKGKTVVIKLKPTVELYRLPTLPKFHMFDYFSKATLALPPTLTETNGIRKEMIYVPSTSADIEEYYRPTTSKSLTHSTLEDEKDYINKRRNIAMSSVEVKPNINIEDPSTSRQRELNEFSVESNDNIGETFKKISDVIQSQYYPTFADFNKDYSKYYNPERKHEKESEIIKVDKLFNSDKVPDKFQVFGKTQLGHHNQNGEHLPPILGQEHISSVEDKSRDNYPLIKYYYNLNETNVPEYKSSLKQLPHKSNINDATEEGGYIVLKNEVPLNHGWYTEDNKNYDKESYTYDPEGNKRIRGVESLPIGGHYIISENLYNSNIEKPYLMIGNAPVPLTENWYKKVNSEHRNSHPVYFAHGELS